jgi:hypothetical protein
MTPLSKCHGRRVVIEDGEYICTACWNPCEVTECEADRADAGYERARERARMPEELDL